ncbi:MAG: bifunctional phosphoribosylaminoimidazolecarboxamide formyltransferase/IMP cyclohydrolase [Planctomycetota bacterium]|nr:bifunctional phosphoribosylaminoimidazolecarboxamide formyltransferase/IMP cyclohydrolase [Planctomycetota bacterium]
MTSNTRRALVSVSDKTDLEPFVKGLVALGFDILSTGGTRKFLEGCGVKVIDVTTYTSFPEIMDGRVKTLHPKVHGAILGRPDHDAAAIAEHGIEPIELVVCNLYPFEATIAKEGVTWDDAVENIDIGGPSMIRSAAKNHAHVAVVTSAAQYSTVLAALQAGTIGLDERKRLAAQAFEMTARYDRAIANYFERKTATGESPFTPTLALSFELTQSLRYGENPHQRAAFYRELNAAPGTLAAATQKHGKELSYNNLLDIDAALNIVREFSAPAVTVIKHNNPCGCAIAETLAEALEKAHAGDPVSAFGSVIGFNRPVDAATAEGLCTPGRFVEAVIAPAITAEAFELLTTKPKWKNNVRLIECPGMTSLRQVTWDYRRVTGGLLVQDRDEFADAKEEWKVVTDREPTAAERRDLEFAWIVCRHVKSNAIVYVKEGMAVGVGAGQMSRLDSAEIARKKAGERAEGGAAASDAFFPFRDGIDQLAAAGIKAVIQPGGSVKDAEVIAACNEHGIAMLFTGRRHFKH